MSKTNHKNANIRHRSLNGSGQKYKSAASLKATNTTYVKTTKKSSRPAQTTKEEKSTPPVQTAANSAPDSKKHLMEPAFLTTKHPNLSSLKDKNHNRYNWKLIIPAAIAVLCLALFVISSQAGWIQTFLTPQSRRIVQQVTTEEPATTLPPETTQPTTQEVTTIETTTEEPTTVFTPSYYVIDVNLGYNRVTVYARGEKLNDGYDPKDPYDDEYEKEPVIAFTCSPGLDGSTPTGTYYLQDRSAWCLMIHDVYTQYATRIVDDVMFHSIPYLSQDPGDLATADYNILGQDASSACIRLNVRDASWIYNNCAYDTEVNIFYDYDYPGPIDPEPTYHIPEELDPLCRWDPTDVYYSENPWLSYDAYLSYSSVEVPSYSSADALIRAFGPTDEYHHDMSNYFYTDGGYDLEVPGTYHTTAHIDVANCQFSFPVTITVTEEYYAGDEEYYDENDEYDEDGDGYDDEYSDDENSDDENSDNENSDNEYSDDEYSEDDYGYDDTGNDEYSEYDAAGPEGEDIQYSEDW